jgi:ATP-binding cassette subfamily C protein
LSRAQGSGILALLRDYRQFSKGRLWLALALMLAGAIAEGFGLLMIVPLATIALRGSNSQIFRYAPWAARWSNEQRFAVALALFLGAMLLRSLLLLARDVLLATLRAEYEADLRIRAAATLAKRGWAFASGIGQAGMQSLLLNDVPRAGETAAYLQQMAVAATMIIVELALTFALSPALTLIACVVLAGGWFFSLHFARRGVRSGLAIVDAMESSAGSGFRLHAGLKAALAQGTVVAFLAEYRSSLRKMTGQLTGFTRGYSFVQQAAGFGAACAAALLLFVGFRLLELPIPVLIASLVLFARMTTPAQALQNSALHAAAYAPSFAAIVRRLGELDRGGDADPVAPPLEWHELKLETASYEHRPGLGVTGASLTLQAGEWLGIDGPSGSGKTTLMDLVAGLLPRQLGYITVDGRPLRAALLDGWRAALSYVGQEGSIFNDSIRANLLAEGVTASDAELWQVLEITGLAARIRAIDSGLDEGVGDRGSHLSGGERQRLVLARALLRRPTLLILDEATAALDPASEGELLERIKGLVPCPAALVVAHRESTLRHCDSRLSLQHGEVAQVAQRN